MTNFDLARLLDPEHTECFLPLDGKTHCNSLARVFCAARGVYLPAVVANQQHDFLADPANGWKLFTWLEASVAIGLAPTGDQLVLASWKNPTGGHGHIAAVVGLARDGRPLVCAAGARNFNAGRLEDSFGLSIHPDFFFHPTP